MPCITLFRPIHLESFRVQFRTAAHLKDAPLSGVEYGQCVFNLASLIDWNILDLFLRLSAKGKRFHLNTEKPVIKMLQVLGHDWFTVVPLVSFVFIFALRSGDEVIRCRSFPWHDERIVPGIRYVFKLDGPPLVTAVGSIHRIRDFFPGLG